MRNLEKSPRTLDEFMAMDLGKGRHELIHGDIYSMSPSPSSTHQSVSSFVSRIFLNYFAGKACRFFNAPLDVFLGDNCVVPDAIVVCNKDKIKKNGCHGAPDLIIEILSPTNSVNDKLLKLNLYREFGVKEYWIIDPLKEGKIVAEVYCLEQGSESYQNYSDGETAASLLFSDLQVSVDDLAGYVWGG